MRAKKKIHYTIAKPLVQRGPIFTIRSKAYCGTPPKTEDTTMRATNDKNLVTCALCGRCLITNGGARE